MRKENSLRRVGVLIIIFILLLIIIPLIHAQTKPEEENSVNFFDRIVNFFRNLFGNNLDDKDEMGLDGLCSGEDECISFCEENIEQCESYCTGKENELCRIIFLPGAEDDKRFQQKENCVSNPKPVFTHTFADITKITWISQYGNSAFYNPGSQARSYVAVREGESTPVYAPTNVTVTRIYFSDKNYTQFFKKEFIRPEYRIDFTVSCEVRVAYDHIVILSDKLKAYAPKVPSPGKNDGVVVSIPLQTGEVIGYTSGGFPGRAFDFFFLNYARKAEHLNPSQWTTDHSLYMDCPYNYFPDELKQQYLAFIDEEKGARSCGPRVREVSNTILGYWFKGDATETNGSRFAIYGCKYFVEWTLILGTESPIAYRDNDAVRIDPETVTEGKTACYYDSDRNAYVYVKMLPGDKVALAGGTGVCPTAFPEDKADVFER